MKPDGRFALLASCTFALLLLAMPSLARTPLGNGFLYSRSNMKINGEVLQGKYDFRFRLYTEATGGNQVGPTVDIPNIDVANGRLPAQILNFDSGAFNGLARFIEVRARRGDGGFLLVGPRQRLRPVPYALALPGIYTVPNDVSPNVIGGYAGNSTSSASVGSTICGGGSGAHGGNVISSDYCTIGGGALNIISINSNFATVGGGWDNTILGPYCTTGGGLGNTTTADRATIGGGYQNSMFGTFGTIGGGDSNVVNGLTATVGGGKANQANGTTSTVGGGDSNVASGFSATIPGGFFNGASGDYSFAAGRRAKANHNGSFVWGDSTNADIGSFASNSVTMRAVNGFLFYTNSSLTSGAAMGAGAGSWTSLSDRNRKTDVQPIDPRAILDKVANLPITSWRYHSQPASIRHIGPMAQDFNPAFGVGEFQNGITTIDIDGVALAAIQGLHQIVQEKDAEIATLRKRLERIEQMLIAQSGSAIIPNDNGEEQ